MKSNSFVLPGVALPTLETAIRAYYLAYRDGKHPISTAELARFTEDFLPKYQLNGRETSASFLCATGILRSREDGRYSLTDLGITLGRAIKDFREEQVSACWTEAIGYCEFINDLFHNYIRPVGIFDQLDLESEIVHRAGRVIKSNSRVGAHCIVDIMERGGYILKRRDGRDTTILVNQGKFRPLFINNERISALRHIGNSKYDLRKLIRLCEEINLCYENQCYYAVGVLSRALLDHVPPIFGFKKFEQVVSQYQTTRSLHDTMHFLHESSRKIADSYLHHIIIDQEEPANSIQVSFSPALDVLFLEIIRLLVSSDSKS